MARPRAVTAFLSLPVARDRADRRASVMTELDEDADVSQAGNRGPAKLRPWLVM